MDLKKKSTTLLSLINPKYRKYRAQYIMNGMVSKKQDWAYRELWTMGLLSLEFTGLRKLKVALETDIKINLDPAVWFLVSWYIYVSPTQLIDKLFVILLLLVYKYWSKVKKNWNKLYLYRV